MKKHISVFTPCYNEEGNMALLIEIVAAIFEKLPQYTYDHVIVDNNSTDKTQDVLREKASKDKRIKIILNELNFGWVRSHFHGLRQCDGDAVIFMSSDFQDPPEMIPQFLQKWEEGYKMVLGIKKQSKENPLVFAARKFFYKLLASFSDDQPTIQNFTGFGLYDKKFISVIREVEDSYPYFRGLVSEFGFTHYEIPYSQPKRFSGKSKANFFMLYDLAVLGFTSHSKLPLRLAAVIGFISASISFLVAIGYFIYKLLYWDNFLIGTAPVLIGVFFFSSVQLFFIGIIGEYIGAIHTQVRKRPLVIEKERINF